MREIPLSGAKGFGKVAIVDDDMYFSLICFRWHVVDGYAVRQKYNRAGQRLVMMHRVVCETPKGMITDHINGDRLDNRKSNLRICDRQQNVANRRLRKKTVSGLIGVRNRANGKSYQSAIMKNKKVVHIGEFNDKFMAGIAYDLSAIRIHGDFAVLNYPEIARLNIFLPSKGNRTT